MAIAEIFIGALITVLFEKLASADLIRLARSAGIDSELNKWKNTLSQIQAVLVDAGQKHLKETAVQLWLNKLQHLAYDIDNILDDLATEAMGRRLNQESDASMSKVFKFFPTKFHALKYGRKMSSKLDQITTDLRALVEEKNILRLINNIERSNQTFRRLEETSLVDVSKVVGREGDKEVLLKTLLSNESCDQNVSIVSIVGLGGIGKTTLAQVLFKDKKVKDHFELMSWVCVSEEFDVFNVSKAIFKDVGGEDKKFETLNQLQVALTDELTKKRFLIVLDDVWNENYNEWELLQRPFLVGAPGSKVIVTTRKTMVASVMDSVQAYPLELLSDAEALPLFAQHALGKQNFDSHPTLKQHGEGIMRKCGGLPLALRTLGRVLRTKTSDEEWKELLNSEIWNLQNEGNILPALMLSYYDLPPHLKQMFAYCSLFPKDYVFNKNELVLLWMAEGFLYESNGSKSMESLGSECFKELESRSFFQRSTSEESRYRMHDLINDLAKSVAGEFLFSLENKMDVCNMNGDLTKLHHFSFIHHEHCLYRKFEGLQRARRLRTILAMPITSLDEWSNCYVSNKVLKELVPQLHFLRVLSLANYNIREVPHSIGCLKHMRYLNFSNTDITCLPEQIGYLYNLQSLLVSGCAFLSSLPNSFVKLKHLRHLDISNTPLLNKMPLGIGGLMDLQTLSKVIIGGANGFKISEMKDLLHLKGQISIKELQNVLNAKHAREADLEKKKGLCDLELEWSEVFNDSGNDRNEYEVLEALRPDNNLKSLKILYYMGTEFPTWIGDPSFDCLTHLTLRGCRSCTHLPTLGHLRSLKTLIVKSMSGLKRVGSELLRSANSSRSIVFASLEVLKFSNMEGLEEWSTKGGDGAIESFPCLREISLENCPKLDVVEVESMPSLQVLHIRKCGVAVLRSLVGVSSKIVKLTMIDIKGLTQLHREDLEHLREVEYLRIDECNELTYLWKSEAEAYQILVCLQKLEVIDCENLVSLGEKKVDSMINHDSFRELHLRFCPKLKSYSITSVTSSPLHEIQSSLKILDITYCHNLEVSLLPYTCLSSLDISSLPNLLLFSERCLVHLTGLVIYNCDNIESIPENGFGFLPFLCLRYLDIDSCRNLLTFPHKHLQSLTSLEELTIRDCPKLDHSFPCGLWPPNMSTLEIGCLKKPMSEWGEQNFPTSLVNLTLHGKNSGVVSFAKAEDPRNNNTTSSSTSFLLPSSLASLRIFKFMDLESLSKGLQHLTCLETLQISSCPKLKDLPETLLPSLSCLSLHSCQKLMCWYRIGKYRSVISQLPLFQVLRLGF